MSEESIFLDESGDFGSNSKYYLVTLVFHNQGIRILQTRLANSRLCKKCGLATRRERG